LSSPSVTIPFRNGFAVFPLIYSAMGKDDKLLGRLEEGVNSMKGDINELKDTFSSIDQRLRKIEDWRIWILGWTTAISFVMSFLMRSVIE
jgi:hypothetical protein